MKKFTKSAKLIFTVLPILLFILFYSCSKQQLNTGERLQTTTITQPVTTDVTTLFNKKVGAPIDVNIGNQWIDNFKKSNRGMGKEYVIQSKDLKTILSNTSCVGICFYFAIDDNNMAQLLPVGVNENGRVMKTMYINTPNGPITWETALKWIANDPSTIDARFFGSDTFTRLFNDISCTSVRASAALDENNKPQLLLGNAATNYRDTNNSSPTSSMLLKYEDRSSVCPPVCGIFE